MTPSNPILNLLQRFVRLFFLQLVQSLRLLQALFSPRIFTIKTKYADQPVTVRGMTSDIQAFIEVFIFKIYKIPSEEVTTIMDIGANAGYASIYFAHFFPNARIIAVEPEHSNYQILIKNTMNHRNIICIQSAIWPHEAELALQNPQASNWAFHYKEASNTESGDVIKSQTLPGLMAKFNLKRLNILKIDIEGSEKGLFGTGAEWLSLVDCMQIEIHTKEARKMIFKALAIYPHTSSDAFDNYYILLHHPLADSLE